MKSDEGIHGRSTELLSEMGANNECCKEAVVRVQMVCVCMFVLVA